MIPSDANPNYVPGKVPGEGDHKCPKSLPFVIGDTASCGCMDQYHGKVCSEHKCCSATYECYGNCGDYTDLYIFLAVVGSLVLAVYASRCGRAIYNSRDRGPSLQTALSAPKPSSNEPSSGKSNTP